MTLFLCIVWCGFSYYIVKDVAILKICSWKNHERSRQQQHNNLLPRNRRSSNFMFFFFLFSSCENAIRVRHKLFGYSRKCSIPFDPSQSGILLHQLLDKNCFFIISSYWTNASEIIASLILLNLKSFILSVDRRRRRSQH